MQFAVPVPLRHALGIGQKPSVGVRLVIDAIDFFLVDEGIQQLNTGLLLILQSGLVFRLGQVDVDVANTRVGIKGDVVYRLQAVCDILFLGAVFLRNCAGDGGIIVICLLVYLLVRAAVPEAEIKVCAQLWQSVCPLRRSSPRPVSEDPGSACPALPQQP